MLQFEQLVEIPKQFSQLVLQGLHFCTEVKKYPESHTRQEVGFTQY